jgi:hypothetical protein
MSDLINELCKGIEKKYNSEKIASWSDHDYKRLNQMIFEETNISISPQTLKRLFGKVKYKEGYTPQPATTDALAKFLGFKDWQAFVKAKNNRKLFSPDYKYYLNIAKSYKKVIIISLALVVLILIAGAGIFFKSDDQPVLFSAENLSGITPYTVSFHYDISKIKGNNVYIDFDQHETDDPLSKEKLDKNLHLINHCFESPGFYNVRLWVNGQIKSTIKVHILSDGWTSYYFNDDNCTLRKFVFGLEKRVKDINKDGLLYISPKDVNDQGFNGNTVYYLEHLLYKKFGLSADSCLWEVKFKNGPQTEGISCYDVEFKIIGENGQASFMLVQKGCHQWSDVNIGEMHVNGKFNDLSKLQLDLASWNIMKFKVNAGNASIICGDDTVFSCAYKQPIGEIKGLRFVTKGSGAFEYMKLLNNNNQLIYKDNFDD